MVPVELCSLYKILQHRFTCTVWVWVRLCMYLEREETEWCEMLSKSSRSELHVEDATMISKAVQMKQ